MARPLPLRPEQPPDDTTVVLRGGVMSVDSVKRAAERTFDLYAVFGISVEGVLETTVQEGAAATGSPDTGRYACRPSVECAVPASRCSRRSTARTSRSCCRT